MRWFSKISSVVFTTITALLCIYTTSIEASPHEERIQALQEFKKSNLNYTGYPLSQKQATQFKGKLKRWDTYPIPVYINNAPFVKPILQRYESFSHQFLFKINPIDKENIPKIKKGIIITQGTAYKPRDINNADMTPVPAMGTTSGELGGWNYPNGFPLSKNGAINGVIYINLATYETLKQHYGEYVSLPVLHEVGHALGLFGHIDGFDDSAFKPVDIKKLVGYTSMLIQPVGSTATRYQQIIDILNYQQE